MDSPKKMRTGFTTGTCAAAGAKAGVLAISGQKKILQVDVMLPRGDTIKIGIKECRYSERTARCAVIKDGGDDPDVTHGAQIVTEISLTDDAGDIVIEGGQGVGTVTKPGLGLEIGGPAINPVPKSMIAQSVRDAGAGLLARHGVRAVISVPDGEKLAPKTDNPRLGIVGGISILGTSGIVVPFSTASFAASIRQNLDVAVAMNDEIVILTTGGRSEAFARQIIDLPDHCFVQMGDFVGYTIQQCAKKRIKKAYVVGFIGKLAKMAAGVKQTHVKGSKVDMGLLAELASKAQVDDDTIRQIRMANTARHVLEIVQDHGAFFDELCRRVHESLDSQAGPALEVILFDFEGRVLGRYGQ